MSVTNTPNKALGQFFGITSSKIGGQESWSVRHLTPHLRPLSDRDAAETVWCLHHGSSWAIPSQGELEHPGDGAGGRRLLTLVLGLSLLLFLHSRGESKIKNREEKEVTGAQRSH